MSTHHLFFDMSRNLASFMYLALSACFLGRTLSHHGILHKDLEIHLPNFIKQSQPVSPILFDEDASLLACFASFLYAILTSVNVTSHITYVALHILTDASVMSFLICFLVGVEDILYLLAIVLLYIAFHIRTIDPTPLCVIAAPQTRSIFVPLDAIYQLIIVTFFWLQTSLFAIKSDRLTPNKLSLIPVLFLDLWSTYIYLVAIDSPENSHVRTMRWEIVGRHVVRVGLLTAVFFNVS